MTFNIGFAPDATNLESKTKSPPKTIFFLLLSSTFSSSFCRVGKVHSWSDSEL